MHVTKHDRGLSNKLLEFPFLFLIQLYGGRIYFFYKTTFVTQANNIHTQVYHDNTYFNK